MLSLHGEVTRIYLAPEGDRALSTEHHQEQPFLHTGQVSSGNVICLSPHARHLPTPLPDPPVRKRRKRMGGNSGKNFAEGWVEFEDKRGGQARGRAAERQAHGRQAALGVPLRPVVPQVPQQVQVGPPHRGDRCAQPCGQDIPSMCYAMQWQPECVHVCVDAVCSGTVST